MSFLHRPKRSLLHYLGYFVFMLLFWTGGEALIHWHWPPPWLHVPIMAAVSTLLEAFFWDYDE